MDDRAQATAAFALRLSADILSALVVCRVLSKAHAELLITESLKTVLESHADHEPRLRQIAATLTQQVRAADQDRDRMERER